MATLGIDRTFLFVATPTLSELRGVCGYGRANATPSEVASSVNENAIPRKSGIDFECRLGYKLRCQPSQLFTRLLPLCAWLCTSKGELMSSTDLNPPTGKVQIAEISPIAASLVGGIEVTITGSGFQPGAEVFFGSRRI